MLKRKPDFVDQQKAQKISKTDLFSAIPGHNQLDILRKLNFIDFVEFKQCSKKTVELTKDFRHRLPLEVEEIEYCANAKTDLFESVQGEPVYLKTEKFCFFFMDPNKDRFENLEKLCQNIKIETKELSVISDEAYDSSLLINNLMKLLNPSVLWTLGCPSSILPKIDGLNKLNSIIFGCATMEESVFLTLNNPPLIDIRHDNSLTASAVNKFLKLWVNEEKNIKRLLISPIPDQLSEIFKDMEFALRWTPENNNFSSRGHLLFCHLPVELYSLEKEDGKKLCAAFGTVFGAFKLMAIDYDDDEDIEKWFPKIFDEFTEHDYE